MKRAVITTALAMTLGLGASPQAIAECLQVPVNCRVSSAFGKRYNPIAKDYSAEVHRGIDFACPMFTKVVAAADATVDVAGNSSSAGNWVRTNAGGLVLKYMHNERLDVIMGQAVKKGQKLADSGNTGRSTGPHLHFQVEEGGKAVDPQTKFCSAPEMSPGVMQGDDPTPEVLGATTRSSYEPNDQGGAVTPIGFEGAFIEILKDAIAARATNPDYQRQLAKLREEGLYKELAFQSTLRLRVKHENLLIRERTLATHAMLQVLAAEQYLKPQLQSQRQAAAQQR
jgi:murein DD-endopeptidase MepM/ murein hydrolase activator NlpD